jgi:hypothetical protein
VVFGEGAEEALEALRAQLRRMGLKALKQHARKMGVAESKIEDADDADDIKSTVIELCVDVKARELAEQAQHEEASASVTACRWVVLAAGFQRNNIPDVPGLEENSYSYNDMPTDREFYNNKTVAILGAGNAAFETWKAIMDDAAYVHIHGKSRIRFAWETHYVGDLRSVNTLPIDNYQLKSQDILHLPSPFGLTREDTTVTKETMPDGKEAVCFLNNEQTKMKAWVRDGQVPAHLHGVMEGHSLTFEERVSNLDHYCYDVVIRCTGFEIDTSIFNLSSPLALTGGRAKRKYPDISAEYESTSAPGLYVRLLKSPCSFVMHPLSIQSSDARTDYVEQVRRWHSVSRARLPEIVGWICARLSLHCASAVQMARAEEPQRTVACAAGDLRSGRQSRDRRPAVRAARRRRRRPGRSRSQPPAEAHGEDGHCVGSVSDVQLSLRSGAAPAPR